MSKFLTKTALGCLLSVTLSVLALDAAFITVAQSADPVAPDLKQGWSTQDRYLWYGATQGSRLIPLSWLKALEEANGTELFLRADNMASFGYLTQSTQPGALPLGFAVDRGPDTGLSRTNLRWMKGQGPDERWVGLNCSACHTSQLTYKNNVIRLDGGPSISNFQAFVESLNASLAATRDDTEKWARFSKRLFPSARERSANDALLKSAFSKLVDWQLTEGRVNQASLVYGPGRVDAFGHILNKIGLVLDPTFAGNPSDAPVSIPFIWRAPQYDRVQYNGIAPKITVPGSGVDIGALARNTGEVIGVFGDIVPNGNPGVTNGFVSSLKTRNMMGLEDLLKKLQPPAWPVSVFGPINQQLSSKGATLFKDHCSNCHMPIARTDLTTPVQTEMSLFDGTGKHSVTGKPLPAPGTDPWMACNTYAYYANSGILNGYSSLLFTDGKTIGKIAPASRMLELSVVFTLLNQKWNITQENTARFFGIDRPPILENNLPGAVPIPENPARPSLKQAQLTRCFSEKSANLGYTSRPLNGIWATAPYLHNGSVATIYDLLLPAAKRKPFTLGAREYDPDKLGFAPSTNEQKDKIFQFNPYDVDGNPIDGNWNGGHDYNNGSFSDDDRHAIIEYLKSI